MSSSFSSDKEFKIAISLLIREKLPKDVLIYKIMPFLSPEYTFPVHFVVGSYRSSFNESFFPSQNIVNAIIRRQPYYVSIFIFISILEKQVKNWEHQPKEKRVDSQLFQAMVRLCRGRSGLDPSKSFVHLRAHCLKLGYLTMSEQLVAFINSVPLKWLYHCRFFGIVNQTVDQNQHIFLPSPIKNIPKTVYDQITDVKTFNFVPSILFHQQYKMINFFLNLPSISISWAFDSLIFSNNHILKEKEFNLFVSILIKRARAIPNGSTDSLFFLFSYFIWVCSQEIQRETGLARFPNIDAIKILHNHWIKIRSFDPKSYNHLIRYAIACDKLDIFFYLIQNNHSNIHFNFEFLNLAILKNSSKFLDHYMSLFSLGKLNLSYSGILNFRSNLIINSKLESFLRFSIFDMGFRPSEQWIIDNSIYRYQNTNQNTLNDKKIILINNMLKELTYEKYKIDWLRAFVYFMYRLLKPNDHRRNIDIEHLKNISKAILECARESGDKLSHAYSSMIKGLLSDVKQHSPFVTEQVTETKIVLWNQLIQHIETILGNYFVIEPFTSSSIEGTVSQKKMSEWIQNNQYDRIKHVIHASIWYPKSIDACKNAMEDAIRLNYVEIVKLFMEVLHLPIDQDILSTVYRNGHVESAIYLSSVTIFHLSQDNWNSVFRGTGHPKYQKLRNSDDFQTRKRFFDTVMILLNGSKINRMVTRLEILDIINNISVYNLSKQLLNQWSSHPLFLQWLNTGECEIDSKGVKRSITHNNDNETIAKRNKKEIIEID